jgi:acetolactate synthase regulatory subunit
MAVLFQYAYDDGPIHLYDIWKEPVWKTLELIEHWLTKTIIGFNLSFDHLHVVKIYTIWRLLPPDWIPEEHIEEIALREPDGRDGPAVKPAGALDLMLHSRKGPYQALMARGDIYIRRVPTALSYALAEELEKRVQLDSIYFARKADPDAPRWQVFDREKDGEFDADFKDVVLRFAPAGGLKFLAEHAMGMTPKYHYEDVEPPKSWYPIELGFAPFALAISSPEKNWEVWGYDKKKEQATLDGHAWPAKIKLFIEHWATNVAAREYAYLDIVYTRALDEHFEFPALSDNDSILATMVAVVRWRGFQIDVEAMKALRAEAQAKVDASPVNPNKPSEVRAHMLEVMNDEESVIIEDSTKKSNLEKIREWKVEEDEECGCEGGCPRCKGTGWLLASVPPCEPDMGNHPAAYRAKELLDIKVANKERELYDKLILAGRFHADFIVVGTKSSRMSGASGLNAQGIKATKKVRRCFPLAWDNFVLCGGDFDSFEVTLADAVYNDPALRTQLVQKIVCPFCDQTKVCHYCGGSGCKKCGNTGKCNECDSEGLTRRKLHGLFGMSLFPGHTYEDILSSAGTHNDMYGKGKSGIFAMIYGGNYETLVRNLGVREENARAAFEDFDRRFPGVGKARQKTFDAFCPMKQSSGPGTAVIWADPSDYVESFLGFRRYFTLENRICKALFDLAQAPPKEWKKCTVKVWRRDRVQTAGGAVSSALYGAAFGLQQANMRAAANHEIQSPGGEITKAVQRRIWDKQPVGVHELVVACLNVHDEIMCVTHPDYVDPVAEVVEEVVVSYRDRVPLLGMTWNKAQANWAEKKGGSVTLAIRAPEMS